MSRHVILSRILSPDGFQLAVKDNGPNANLTLVTLAKDPRDRTYQEELVRLKVIVSSILCRVMGPVYLTYVSSHRSGR
jgi:hypothetical protein